MRKYEYKTDDAIADAERRGPVHRSRHELDPAGAEKLFRQREMVGQRVGIRWRCQGLQEIEGERDEDKREQRPFDALQARGVRGGATTTRSSQSRGRWRPSRACA